MYLLCVISTGECVVTFNHSSLFSTVAPVCAEQTPQVVGAAIDEALRVRCSVHADPADVTFFWQFNNSGESFNVSPARYGKFEFNFSIVIFVTLKHFISYYKQYRAGI